MDIVLTIIAVIVIFSALVLIHEYGHFMAARRAGIKVLEFGIGFPPRLFKKKIGETTYTINAVPFGGFVKLHGEDSSDPAVLKDPRSFAHKSPWVRTKVIVAGVVMNFLLAIFLLTLGFSFGIEPLLVNEQDLLTNIEKGVVQTAPGAYISGVPEDIKKMGVSEGDRILAINDKPVLEEEQLAIFQKGGAKSDVDITILSVLDGQTKKVHLPVMKGDTLGIKLKPFTRFPRIEVLDVKAKSSAEKAGLRAGDTIYKMNGKDVYSIEEVGAILESATSVTYTLLRDNKAVEVTVPPSDARKVVIANVVPGSAAETAGFKKGDSVLSMNGTQVRSPSEMQEQLKNSEGKDITFQLSRNGEQVSLIAKTGEGNILGVEMSSLTSYQNADFSYYRGSVLTSITQIGKVRYNPWVAFKQAISESYRLTGLTISAFGKTVTSIVSKFQVPGDVGGPVQIAYYTHAFVQEGIFALLRFMALLSLSLAVINILPIPALDGGRFLFIVLEVLFKRRVSARTEAIVHGLGFIVLMGFILLITYSDITKLF